MRLKLVTLAVAVFALTACTVKTQIIEPDGSVYTIKSGSDALVVMKGSDWEATIDNRGQPNIFQSLTQWLLLQTPEVIKAE